MRHRLIPVGQHPNIATACWSSDPFVFNQQTIIHSTGATFVSSETNITVGTRSLPNVSRQQQTSFLIRMIILANILSVTNNMIGSKMFAKCVRRTSKLTSVKHNNYTPNHNQGKHSFTTVDLQARGSVWERKSLQPDVWSLADRMQVAIIKPNNGKHAFWDKQCYS